MNTFICTAVAVVIAAGFVASAYGAGSQGFNTSPHVEAHPEIDHAINKLENAQEYLQQDPQDYGGHRSKASRAC